MVFRIVLVGAVTLAARTGFAHLRDDPSEPGRAAILALAERYRACESVAYSARGKSSDGTSIMLRVVAHRNGTFRVEHYAQNRARGQTWDALPMNVAAFDGMFLRCSRNEGGTFHEVPLDIWANRAPGPVQMIFAPWVYLDRVVPAVAADAKAEYQRVGDRWSVRSTEAGVVLNWRDDGRLERFERICDGPSIIQATSTLSPTYLPAAGTTLVESLRTGVVRNGIEVGAENTYQMVEFATNPADIDRRMIFDLVALGLNRFDPETKNVYDPSGRLLYNEDAAVGKGGAASMSPVMLWGGLGTVAAGSIVIAWRRLRPGRA